MRWKKTGLLWGSTVILAAMVAFQAMAHSWMAPEEEAEMANPVAPDEESVSRGKEVYNNICAACHGEDLEGLKAEETGLEMDTPNLKQRLKTHTEGDFFWKINEGRGEMPSFKDELTDEEMWHIINHIREETE